MIQLTHISRSYQMGDQRFFAVKDVSLRIDQGEFVAILGPSGCGKSSLLYILGLLDQASEGQYSFEGRSIEKLEADQLASLRGQRIGFVFQQFGLIPRLSALENVALPSLYRQGYLIYTRAQQLLSDFGLGERLHHAPNQLSGGQQQRVAIARALMNTPNLILADEPTGALDSKSSEDVLNVLKHLHAQGNTLVLITHDPWVANQAERILTMKDGRIISDTQQSQGLSRAIEETPNALSSTSTLRKFFSFSLQGLKVLRANKVRSALSILGILIGVAAVVTMLAVGGGAKEAVKKELSSLGSNLLVVRKGSGRMGTATSGAGTLSLEFSPQDAEKIKETIPGVIDASPNISGQAQATYLNHNWNTAVQGADINYPSMRAAQPASGRYFTVEEIRQKARVALVGQTVIKNLFPTEDPLGKWIRIQKTLFQVIGTLPIKGASTFRDQDDVIIIPYTTAQFRVFGKTSVDYFDVQVSDPLRMPEVQAQIEALLLQRHRVPPSQRQGAIMVHNMSDIQKSLASTTGIISVLLSIVAAIALIVGGIGIMNIMLVTVTERTREIGLRKAMGATHSDILFQFLVESTLLSVLGGVLGMALGIGLTLVIAKVAGWVTLLSSETLTVPMAFSSLVGIFFGLYPASKAAKLQPLEALRYE